METGLRVRQKAGQQLEGDCSCPGERQWRPGDSGGGGMWVKHKSMSMANRLDDKGELKTETQHV